MVVTATALMGNMALPDTRIPDNAPLAPYALSGAAPSQAPTAVQVNPQLTSPGGGYVLTICNTSGQTRRIDGETVTIASVTPFSGPLKTWVFCSSQYIAEQHTVVSGGCGGSDFANDFMRATFPSGAGAGATASAKMYSVDTTVPPAIGPLPVSLPPDQMMSIEVGLTGPVGPATYVFSFALAVDGAAPKTVATSQPTLLAPATQQWTGENCQTAAMQAKMPATGQFVCPPAS